MKEIYYETIYFPKADDQLTLQVKRAGKVLKLAAQPKRKKLKYPRMKVNGDRSEAQKSFNKMYFYKELGTDADQK